MEVKQLKFLLKLLEKPGYQSKITEIKPTPKMKASERDSICRSLSEDGYVAYEKDIKQFRIEPAGKGLLNSANAAELPISEDEIKVLKAVKQKSMTPGKLKIKADKQKILHQMCDRGLIEATKTQITQVWLADGGKDYLATKYESDSTTLAFTPKMLSDYVSFLRQYFAGKAPTTAPSARTSQTAPLSTTNAPKPTDDAILQLIKDLDYELGTDNYLPIFHLREKLQPPMTRKEVDEALYRLQGDDKIELSALAEVQLYTPEQQAAGIAQIIGGSLFFIIHTD